MAEQMTGQGFGMSLDDVEEWLTGQAVCMYKITALMEVRPFPAPSAEQRERFADAIDGLFSRMVMRPSVQWDSDTKAEVTLACGGEDTATAGQRAKEIIDRNAANMAHLYITGIEVIQIKPLEGHGQPPSVSRRRARGSQARKALDALAASDGGREALDALAGHQHEQPGTGSA